MPSSANYAQLRAEARNAARQRADARIRIPVSESTQRRDLLFEEKRGRAAIKLFAYGLLALGLHGAIVLGLLTFGEQRLEDTVVLVERVIIRTVDLPAWPDKEEESVGQEPAVEANAPEPEATPTPTKMQKPKQDKRPRPRDIASADPVDQESRAAPETAEPRRRVVGISMESTISAGSGPSFAVGNTRMGKTDREAADPAKVEKLSSGVGSVRSAGTGGPNTVASALPTDGVKFEKPRRLGSARLMYPAKLKAQGIDGDVVVLVRIDRVGSVSKVKVIKSSGYPEFDMAA